MKVGHWFFSFLLLPSLASAQAQSLKDVAQKAVLTHPEVQQRWHAYLAADGERDAAFGGYLPRVDLTAGHGREHRDTPLTRGNYTIDSRTLTLTQMLYDGFATRNEVKRLDHARRVRLFELHEVSETTALEAARAFIDVKRYRTLVALAEDNYVRHRAVFEQIQRKVQAGVARRVDLEQAAGRLALAEANLLTETSNLHDVTARFQRVVGDVPAKELEAPPPLSKGLPGDMATLQKLAQQRSPTLHAAIENVRAADAAADMRKAAYQPRVDLRLRGDRGDNLGGVAGSHAVDTAEVVLSWNLLNGFSDVARSRQFAEQRNVAKDVRDKTCRDVRQNVAIAWNDTRKLAEQLTYLDQHQLSTEKARDAYRKQFDIGQRSLLDLLDTENELFQARRAYANADSDLAIAHARTQAGLGNLLAALGLSRIEKEQMAELADWAAGADMAEQCPPGGPVLYVADKAALDQRAQELIREAMAASAAAAPAAPAAVSLDKPVAEAVKAWAAAWSGRDLAAYFGAYAATFTPADGISRAAWERKRRAIIGRAGDIMLDLGEVRVAPKGDSRAVASFSQRYRSSVYNDVVDKALELERIDGKWLIVAETAAKP